MDELQTGLKRRHVTMIALGGVIGAGLFAGSGAVINQTGPAAVLSYLNSGSYVASRMMFALASRGDAPQWTVQINSRGVPARAILLTTSVGYVS